MEFNGSEKNASAFPRASRRTIELILRRYVTGGIGSMQQWEGFGIDYFLPQGTDEGGCYCETCAAIGVMMMAQRLLQVRTMLSVITALLRHCTDIISSV